MNFLGHLLLDEFTLIRQLFLNPLLFLSKHQVELVGNDLCALFVDFSNVTYELVNVFLDDLALSYELLFNLL